MLPQRATLAVLNRRRSRGDIKKLPPPISIGYRKKHFILLKNTPKKFLLAGKGPLDRGINFPSG